VGSDPAFERLKAAWPVIALAFAFTVGLVAGGFGIALLATTLGFLVVGPAYLIDRAIQRRRHPEQRPPRDEGTQAREGARWLRAIVVYNLIACVCALVLAFARPADWLEGPQWTVALLVFAGQGIASTLYIWAVADLRTTGRFRRRALAASSLVEVVVGSASAIVAVGNHVDGWLGGAAWTIGLAALAAFAFFSAVTCLHRLRASGEAGPYRTRSTG
jgi:hypothetical protein